ncbi:MAG: DUF4314 domain-containing protein [Eubacteriales bacterium]
MTDRITDEQLRYLREKVKPGTRVELIKMDDPYNKLMPGDKGTTTFIDDIGSIGVFWDCGSSLNLLNNVDSYRIINEDDDIKTFIEGFIIQQKEGKLLLCPRCGKHQMRLPIEHNAWSRYADIYICDAECGMDEALRDAFGKGSLPFDQWAAASAGWKTEK